jgi:hypothetical protein
MTEPDVAITDFLLSLEAIIFSVLVWRSADSHLRLPFTVFFASAAAAALTGGIVHGFFTANYSGAGVALWRATLVALGVTALATWAIGARLILPTTASRNLQIVAAAVAAGYAIVVVAVNDSFWVGMAHYLPPTVFLLLAFVVVYERDRRASTLVGVIGVLLTFAAAFVQQRRVALHPVYFNHNALYHAIQALALLFIYWCARGLS